MNLNILNRLKERLKNGEKTEMEIDIIRLEELDERIRDGRGCFEYFEEIRQHDPIEREESDRRQGW